MRTTTTISYIRYGRVVIIPQGVEITAVPDASNQGLLRIVDGEYSGILVYPRFVKEAGSWWEPTANRCAAGGERLVGARGSAGSEL